MLDHFTKTNSAGVRADRNPELSCHEIDSQHLVDTTHPSRVNLFTSIILSYEKTLTWILNTQNGTTYFLVFFVIYHHQSPPCGLPFPFYLAKLHPTADEKLLEHDAVLTHFSGCNTNA